MTPIIIDLPVDELVYEFSEHDKNYKMILNKFVMNNKINYYNMRSLGHDSQFKVSMYKLDKPRYIPYVV